MGLTTTVTSRPTKMPSTSTFYRDNDADGHGDDDDN